jgi:glutaredoxin-dependent peroxiredoxin
MVVRQGRADFSTAPTKNAIRIEQNRASGNQQRFSAAMGGPMPAEVGSKAPDFTLMSHERQPITLSAQRGRPVVLAFFPAAFSSVCTKELCTFRDSLARLNGANAQVFGVSVDTFFTLKAFHDDQKLTFPLLSDFNKQAIRDYGVFNEDMIGLKGIARRAVFVIDKDGIVRHREVLEDARNEPDYDKVFTALAALS